MYSITVHMHKEKQWNLGIWGLDYIAQYLTPFKDALVPGMEAVSVIFYYNIVYINLADNSCG